MGSLNDRDDEGSRPRRRGNPNTADYPIDGRKGALAVKHVIASLIAGGRPAPTGQDIAAAVANHPACDAAIVYRQAMRRLRSGAAIYFRMFGVPDDCRLLGAGYRTTASCEFDLTWMTPAGPVVIEELMAEPYKLPSTKAGAARIDAVVTAAQPEFGERLRGGRVCVFDRPADSLAWDREGNEMPFEVLMRAPTFRNGVHAGPRPEGRS